MDEETIRKAAYDIWEKQGKPHGQDFEHWLQARDSLDSTGSDGLAGGVSTGVTPPTTPHLKTPQEQSSKGARQQRASKKR
ncbi:DUF2934 domain-containing protein [Pseudomonas ovata]|uniref:DUF2934 domain-containing protein n=1 Tax=Pseudomonas ovata TaxID=1839709 RepID=UPI000D69CA6F|nr:DUF2934 domain-containing protein [Pseudomonas ovata]